MADSSSNQKPLLTRSQKRNLRRNTKNPSPIQTTPPLTQTTPLPQTTPPIQTTPLTQTTPLATTKTNWCVRIAEILLSMEPRDGWVDWRNVCGMPSFRHETEYNPYDYDDDETQYVYRYITFTCPKFPNHTFELYDNYDPKSYWDPYYANQRFELVETIEVEEFLIAQITTQNHQNPDAFRPRQIVKMYDGIQIETILTKMLSSGLIQ